MQLVSCFRTAHLKTSYIVGRAAVIPFHLKLPQPAKGGSIFSPKTFMNDSTSLKNTTYMDIIDLFLREKQYQTNCY